MGPPPAWLTPKLNGAGGTTFFANPEVQAYIQYFNVQHDDNFPVHSVLQIVLNTNGNSLPPRRSFNLPTKLFEAFENEAKAEHKLLKPGHGTSFF
jgi:hypothetical protein